MCSPFAAWFPGGATVFHPYTSCASAPHRTGQMVFPYPALRSSIQRGKRVEVDSNAYLGPAHMPKSLKEAVPGIRLALAASIQPFEQRAARQMHVPLTAF